MELHLALLQDTLAIGRGILAPVSLYVAGNENFPFDAGVAIRQQSQGDLGARLHAAFMAELQTHSHVVIIGTDCPLITPELLDSAYEMLDQSDLVLGPSQDGGYYLIGLRTLIPEIFTGIEWSTPAVFDSTIAKLSERNYQLLPTHFDIDEPADLIRLFEFAKSGRISHATHILGWIARNEAKVQARWQATQ